MILAFLQDSADALPSFDWVSIASQLGVNAPLFLWMAYEIFHLRKENGKLNEAARDMASASLEAMTRMAAERKS